VITSRSGARWAAHAGRSNMTFWSDTSSPEWVQHLLSWHGTWLAARFCLCSAYFFGGVTKLWDFKGAVSEQLHFGLRPGWLWAALAIGIEIAAPIMIIANYGAWLAAGALSGLTMVAIVVLGLGSRAVIGNARLMAIGGLLERIGLIGGLMLATIVAQQNST
jgi:uncharacterized membrane protein YphA (DoxX/SURF4 family)